MFGSNVVAIKQGWSEWGSWSTCSTTCGEGGMIRQRHCTGECILSEHGTHQAKLCNLASCLGNNLP